MSIITRMIFLITETKETQTNSDLTDYPSPKNRWFNLVCSVNAAHPGNL